MGVQSQGIVLGPRMSMEGLIWVSRALVGCGVPEMGNEGFGRYGGSDGHGWVGMGVEGVIELT